MNSSLTVLCCAQMCCAVIYRCHIRVIDTFGTEPAYNHEEYATLHGYRTNWGYWNLNPRQYMTMFRKSELTPFSFIHCVLCFRHAVSIIVHDRIHYIGFSTVYRTLAQIKIFFFTLRTYRHAHTFTHGAVVV